MPRPDSSTLRLWGNRLLPRPVVERLSRARAGYERLRLSRHLEGAVAEFDRAYSEYWSSGVVPPDAERILFLASWASGGTATQVRPQRFAEPFRPERFSGLPSDLLSGIDPLAVADAVADSGFCVPDVRLDHEVVRGIAEALDRGPADPRGDGILLAPGAPRANAPSWWMPTKQILDIEPAVAVLQERAVAECAGAYLGVDPMVMSVALWKSFGWKKADKRSAQQFHYDNDRAGFIKMFVYLTDVGPSNGPHVYVRGSHREKPRSLMHGQRLSDDVVRAHYPESSWETITGPSGTIFFADTHGFHKGGRVLEGARSMFQINVGSDRFGSFEPPAGSTEDAPPSLADSVTVAPRYFSQLYAMEPQTP